MAVTDPVDARLLAALAELGKVAVHELAAKVRMDPREVAYRLVALSGSGLPLLVGVESDPNGLRAALAATGGWARMAPPGPPAGMPPTPGARPGASSGPYPPPAPPFPVQGVPSGPYPPPAQGVPSGPYPPPAQGVPSGPYPPPAQGVPSGPYQVQGTPSGRHPVQPVPSGAGAYQLQGAASPYPAPQARPPAPPPNPVAVPAPLDPVISVWGPPQTASWARGDQFPPAAPAAVRTGRVGDVLTTQGLDGEQLSVQLLEVQDPADFLFSAAGYQLEEGERAIVVHTEISNRGAIPFLALPDNYLELVSADGRAVAKAPVSLTSRPPHKIGVQPGETAGGHTVYVVAEATRITAVRWSPRPEPDDRSLTWSLED
ncbi:hypothetical protein [Amycolatopsis taiwanensis]|uniref:hypothetical protein n=1 Tax=Amycolatopsis taiwanensis TaxID=342230 RepID=UPI000485B381|nr:hypothetical protein [Amycolatopsis taiwanensis]